MVCAHALQWMNKSLSHSAFKKYFSTQPIAQQTTWLFMLPISRLSHTRLVSFSWFLLVLQCGGVLFHKNYFLVWCFVLGSNKLLTANWLITYQITPLIYKVLVNDAKFSRETHCTHTQSILPFKFQLNGWKALLPFWGFVWRLIIVMVRSLPFILENHITASKPWKSCTSSLA